MLRRMIRVALPIVVIAGGSCVLLLFGLQVMTSHYRTSANSELAAAIGAMSMESSAAEFDPLPIILEFRHPDSAAVERGEQLLQQYGYTARDFISPSLESYSLQIIILFVACAVVFVFFTTMYFWWRDYHRARQIHRLVKYLQDLNDKIYDLRLAENNEDDLSLLTNELYKIMVTLRESVDQNRKSRQDLETALADISHQLRTPLTSLQIMVDNIYEDPNMPLDVRQDFLRAIGRQVESMSSLVTTLLHLAKFDSKTIVLHRATISAAELLDKVRQNLAILAELSEVELAISGTTDAKITLDLRWQTEALTNIVKNCIEHSSAGSVVELRVINNPLFLRITVVDHGEGISADDVHHIFERFYKSKNSREASIGIGLSLAKTVIESDHGQITVHSQPGVGTEFVVTYFR